MPTKDRLLVLLQTLQEKSDDETWLTTADLRAVLEAEGHEFFSSQVDTFDKATCFLADLENDPEYVDRDEEAHKAICEMRLILPIPQQGAYNYKRIPDLNKEMATVKIAHDKLLSTKRDEVQEMIAAGMAAVHELTGINPTDPQVKNYLAKADAFYTGRREKVKVLTSLALLDSIKPQVLDYTDSIEED